MAENKGKEKSERWVRVCPKCGSEDIVTDDKAGLWKFSGGTLSMYNCKSCGYRSPLFPEKAIEDLKKKR